MYAATNEQVGDINFNMPFRSRS